MPQPIGTGYLSFGDGFSPDPLEAEYERLSDDSARQQFIGETFPKRALQGVLGVNLLAGGLLAGTRQGASKAVKALGAAATLGGLASTVVGVRGHLSDLEKAPPVEYLNRVTASTGDEQQVLDALDMLEGKLSPNRFELRHGYVPEVLAHKTSGRRGLLLRG